MVKDLVGHRENSGAATGRSDRAKSSRLLLPLDRLILSVIGHVGVRHIPLDAVGNNAQNRSTGDL